MESARPSEHPRTRSQGFPPSNGASATHVGAGTRSRQSARTASISKIVRGPILYAQAHAERFVNDLLPFLRFPSISAGTKHNRSTLECARWLTNHLKHIGFNNAQLSSTAGQPIVYASSTPQEDRPTLLIYGHYDVQPVDPLHRWHSPPFVPTRRGSNLIARGASDDKGPLFIHLKALQSYLAASGTLPLNIKCVFEGEEEIGSPHFAEFVKRNQSELQSDFAVISDTRMLSPDRPAITYSQRGMLSLELAVQSAKQDLHSGAFGGAVPNAVQILCEILARVHDKEGRITIPQFYDRVLPVTPEVRENAATHGPSDERFLSDAGTALAWGEPSYTLFERSSLRPAFTINGIRGGYQGPGGKGVIPAVASAKVSFRLVPGQDPQEIDTLFRRYFRKIAPPGIRLVIRTRSRANPAFMDPHHPVTRAAAWAYRQGFGATPVFLPSGGTIPVVNSLKEILGVPVVLMGFALPNDRMHAPNEKMYLPNFERGIATSIWFMAALSHIRERE